MHNTKNGKLIASLFVVILFATILLQNIPSAKSDDIIHGEYDWRGIHLYAEDCLYTLCHHGVDNEEDLFHENDYFTIIGLVARYDDGCQYPAKFGWATWINEAGTGGNYWPGATFYLELSVDGGNPCMPWEDNANNYTYTEIGGDYPDHYCYVHFYTHSNFYTYGFNPRVSSVEGYNTMYFAKPGEGIEIISAYPVPYDIVTARMEW